LEFPDKTSFDRIHLANKNIFSSPPKRIRSARHGATLTAAWIDGAKLSIAHVGDTPGYCSPRWLLLASAHQGSFSGRGEVRRGILTSAEAQRATCKRAAARAGVAQAGISGRLTHFPRDVLCSAPDGLTAWSPILKSRERSQAETNTGQAAENLVALANDAAGPDNITVVIVSLEKPIQGMVFVVAPQFAQNLGSNGTAGGN